MNRSEVESFVEKSRQEGYTEDEIREALMEEGLDQDAVNQVLQEARTGLQAPKKTGDAVSGLDLAGDSYTIKQRLLFNRYHIYDSSQELILKAKQKMFRLKEDIPFMDAEDNVVFRAKAESVIDAGGDYTLTDESSGDPIAVLDRKYTLFRHRWRIRDPETEELLAKVRSEDQTVELVRWIGGIIPYVPNIFGIVPHSYEFVDRNENQMARLEGRFSFRDIYDLEVEDSERVPREALVASAIAIDALESN